MGDAIYLDEDWVQKHPTAGAWRPLRLVGRPLVARLDKQLKIFFRLRTKSQNYRYTPPSVPPRIMNSTGVAGRVRVRGYQGRPYWTR